MSTTHDNRRALEKPLVAVVTLLALIIPLSLTISRGSEGITENETPLAAVTGQRAYAAEISPLAGVFLGSETPIEDIRAMVHEYKEFVSTREAFPASLAVITKHEETIRTYARKHGVPEDVALGIGLLENGGSETAVSSAGALGVFQLMPGTARNLGLTVGGGVDERRDPEKNIDAGMKYLRMNYERFGNWGFSAWAYHAGEGNVVKALKAYALANHGVVLPGIEDFAAHGRFVKKHDLTIHQLLSDPAVETVTARLNDDSSGYPYKVVATAKLFAESKDGSTTPTLTRPPQANLSSVKLGQ